MAEITLPYHEGNVYSFCSIEAKFDGEVYSLMSLNYSEKLEPGVVRGNSPEDQATTRGKYSVTADAELTKTEWDRMRAKMGKGYGLKRFLITAQYAEENAPTVQDELEKCRITEVGNSNSESADGTKIKLTLYVAALKRDGMYMFKKD